jgi:hypothetical protein
MDTLVQSFLEKARGLNAAIHIRYWENKERPVASSDSAEDIPGIRRQGGTDRMGSYVIIHKSYRHLEPVVREIFQGAEDVRVVVDRRWHERRQFGGGENRGNRRRLPDRRESAPMLDILINVES